MSPKGWESMVYLDLPGSRDASDAFTFSPSRMDFINSLRHSFDSATAVCQKQIMLVDELLVHTVFHIFINI